MDKEIRDKIMSYLREYYSANGYSPSVRDICKSVGIRSTATAHYHLNRLAEEGRIRRTPLLSRAIRILE